MRPLARVAFLLWLIAFAGFFGAGLVHDEPALRIASQVLYGVPLAAWGLIRLRGRWDRLDLAVLFAVTAHLIVALVSRDVTGSMGTVPLTAAYAATFLLARREAGSSLKSLVVRGLALGLTLNLLLNAGLMVAEKIRWFSIVGSAPLEGLVVFPWGTVNALPAIVLIAIPFVAWTEPRAVRTILAAGLAAAALVVVPLSMGRAGWLALGVAALAWLLMRGGWFKRIPATRAPALIALASVVGAVAVIAAWPVIASALAPTGRLVLWEQAARMITDQPLVGSGPGTYSWARLEYGPQAARLLPVFLVHNMPLQSTIDGGLILVVGMSVAVVSWIATLGRRLSTLGGADRLALAVLIGFAVSTLLDDFTFNPAVVVAVLVTAGFLAPINSGRTPQFRLARWGPVILATITIAGIGATFAVDRGRLAAEDGRLAAVDGRWPEAVSRFTDATEAHPAIGGHWLGLGMASSYAGDDARAEDSYRRATVVSPGDPRGYAGLAAFAADDQQVALLESAAIRSLGDPTFAVWLSQAHLEMGEPEVAAEAWAMASVLAPQLLRFWDEASGVTIDEIATRALERLDASPPVSQAEADTTRWDILLAADQLPDEAGGAWQALQALTDGRLNDARALAEAVVADEPHAARSYAALAMVAAHGCDDEALEAALRELAVAGGHWPITGAAGRVSIEREFTYRQDGLGATLPPDAPDLNLRPWPWGLVPDPEPCP